MINDGSFQQEFHQEFHHEDAAFERGLYGFAIELRQLAYTMPAGHEDRLINLADRMAAQSRQYRERGSLGA